MAYSTIIKKKCKGNCGKYPKLGYDGYCYSCAPEVVKEKVKSQTRAQRKRARQRLQNKVLALKENRQDSEQELWFRMAAIELESNPHCMECGQWIGKAYYRSATAHILPKRKEYGFPSIATHPLNKLFLCGINGCHNKTHTWSTFATMKVWLLAVAAFKEMYPYIAEEERKNIPDVLREYIPLYSQSG